jgi:hypothetical protein
MFQQVDPQVLEKFEWSYKDVVRRAPMNQETLQNLSLLRRALQALPPRELQFIYLQESKGLVQEETGKMYSVQQQNVSYRLMRASQRIILHYRLFRMGSETQLRRKLFECGFSENVVRVITGVVKTSSQAATAKALGISPGSIRYTFLKVVSGVERLYRDSEEFQILKLMERNLNQLRCTESQDRWRHKKDRMGGGDRPVTEGKRIPDLLGLLSLAT